jgi:hypothetical protein
MRASMTIQGSDDWAGTGIFQHLYSLHLEILQDTGIHAITLINSTYLPPNTPGTITQCRLLVLV